MLSALVIGGTRNLGPGLASALSERGYHVTIFNRGMTAPTAALPETVERLFGDRSDPAAMALALGKREFDLVVDTTLYSGTDAEAAVRLLAGRVRRRYIMLSTGQVYLVRVGLARPFIESSYAGPTTPAPGNDFDLDNWNYGIHKRAAEDALAAAPFPVTILRLPMVNSERDHFERIRNYLARLHDGGPILVPDGPHLPLRHIHGKDAINAVMRAAEAGVNGAFNAGQDETLTIEDFLERLATIAGRRAQIRRFATQLLWDRGLMPNCSHFSEPWMSSLDNSLGKRALGLTYTPIDQYLEALARDYAAHPHPPKGYAQRAAELALCAGQ